MTLPVGKIKKGTIRVDRGDNFFKLVRIVTAYQNPTIPPQVFFPQAWASPYQYSDQYAAVIHLVDETEACMRDKNTFKKTDVDGAPVLYPGDLVKF